MSETLSIARKMAHAATYGNPCPHCQTWDAADCLAGNGCPTPDGRNGEAMRAALTSKPGGEGDAS